MVNDQLLGYVKQQLSHNMERDVITANLKGAGWNEDDISEAFVAIFPPAIPTSIPISPISVGTENVVQSPTYLIQPEHTKRKKILPIITVLILLCMAGGAAGYAYYTGVFVTLPTLIAESMDKAKAVTSSKYDVIFNVDLSEIKYIDNQLNALSSIGIDSKKINFSFKGSSDVSDTNNLKGSSLISFTMGGYLSAEFELRIINNTFFAALKKAPNLGTFPLPIPSISQYENKWFSFPFKLIDGQMTSIPFETMPSVESLGIKFTAEQKEHLHKMFRDAHLVKTIAKLAPETVGGEPSYHFSFDLDRDAIRSYLQSLKEYISTIDDSELTASQLSAFDLSEFDEVMSKLKDFKGEIWIGRNDKLVHKIVLSVGILPDLSRDEQVKVNMSAIFSDYNQPVSIIAPVESVPFMDLLGDARQKGKNAAVKTVLRNASFSARSFYDDLYSYSGLCSSPELKNVPKVIEDNGGTEFFCKGTVKAFVVAAKFSDDSGYWCIDSTGVSKLTTVTPTTTVCPKE